MEFMTKPQEKELNKLATLFADERAKEKGGFPKRHFTPKDIAKMIKNRKRVAPTLISLVKTAGIIKKHDVKQEYRKKITRDEFELLKNYILNDMDMDSFGVAHFEAHEIYAGMGIPYQNVLVLTRHMDKAPFDLPKLPNMECMLEVMKVYGDTGVAALGVTEFLRLKNLAPSQITVWVVTWTIPRRDLRRIWASSARVVYSLPLNAAPAPELVLSIPALKIWTIS